MAAQLLQALSAVLKEFFSSDVKKKGHPLSRLRWMISFYLLIK